MLAAHGRLNVPWKDVLLIDDNLDLVAEEVLDNVEHTMGCRLPTDYRAVMTTFGVGTYCDFVCFTHPDEIPARTKQSREIWAKNSDFFWPQSNFVLSIDLAMQSLVLATTADGDEIIFCPPAQGRLFVLPRHEEIICTMPLGLGDPLVWEAASGSAPETHHFRYFEPSRGRGHVELITARTDLTIDSLYQRILPRLAPGAESVPTIEGDGLLVAFFQSERSRVQLTAGGANDRRIRARISYNLGQTIAVGALIEDLVSTGFREIGRFPGATTAEL